MKENENYANGLSRQINAINSSPNKTLTADQKFKILQKYHNISGHGGVSTLSFLIKNKYKWQGIHEDIKNYCNRCNACKKVGKTKINTQNKIIRTTRPNELWEVDTMGRLKASDNKYKYILVYIDHYSKWSKHVS